MKRLLLILAGLACLAPLSQAEVVRPAPNFTWVDNLGKAQSLASFKGKPIVLVIAPSPRNRNFRAQLGQFKKLYEHFAAQKTIFIVAFTETPGRVRSNIPFVPANDGPRVGFDYGSGKGFLIAIIGRDGNLDYVTSRVLPAYRVYDITENSYAMQEMMRRE